MCTVTEKELQNWGEILNNPETPLVERFRALWGLKHAKEDLAIDMIANAFVSKSELLKHELAYCLGQKKNSYAINVLINILKDKNQEPIVRHEAGEALAAIGSLDVYDTLKEYSQDSNVDVAETCYLGYKRLDYISKNEIEIPKNGFDTVDPAPEFEIKKYSIKSLGDILIDNNADLFDRYRAMFSLRRIANEGQLGDENEALNLICDALFCEGSALFRHEIAFVLGQLAKANSTKALMKSVANVSEAGMVRHESAEALGAIGNEESVEFLKEYLNDKSQVVAESCIVALDMAEYNSSEKFSEYAYIPESMKQ